LFIGDEPFAILLGDDIATADTPDSKQLINKYDRTGSSVIGVQTVADHETDHDGKVDPISKDGRLYVVKEFVEKPALGTVPSNLAIMGRYILIPDIFGFLGRHEMGAGGEIRLTDAIQNLNESQQMFAYDFEGKRYNVGEKLGFIQTNVEFALRDKEIGSEVANMLKKSHRKRLLFRVNKK